MAGLRALSALSALGQIHKRECTRRPSNPLYYMNMIIKNVSETPLSKPPYLFKALIETPVFIEGAQGVHDNRL